jgi:hypothetical protein
MSISNTMRDFTRSFAGEEIVAGEIVAEEIGAEEIGGGARSPMWSSMQEADPELVCEVPALDEVDGGGVNGGGVDDGGVDDGGGRSGDRPAHPSAPRSSPRSSPNRGKRRSKAARVFDADRAVRAHLAAADLRALRGSASGTMAGSIAGSTYRVVFDPVDPVEPGETALEELHGTSHLASVHVDTASAFAHDCMQAFHADHDIGISGRARSDAAVRSMVLRSRESRDGAEAHDAHAAPVAHVESRVCVMLDPHATRGEAGLDSESRAHPRGASLACGAVHEIRGLCLDTDAHAGAPPAGPDHSWLVPFGCIVHILRCMASGHPSNAGCRALLDAGVVWIGDRVHPSLEGLACALQCETPTFAGDDGGVMRGSPMHVASPMHAASAMQSTRGAWESALERFTFVRDAAGGTGAHPRDPVPHRVWCTEQAIRMGAAGVVIVDGTGFDTLAWRRLQLAASGGSSSSPSMSAELAGACSAGADSSMGADFFPRGTDLGRTRASMPTDDAMRPLVLVITPPEGTCGGHADRGGRGRASRGGGGASTRWSVYPSGIRRAHEDATVASSGACEQSRLHGHREGDGEGRDSEARDFEDGHFGWRMQLDAVKRVDAGGASPRKGAMGAMGSMSANGFSRGDMESGRVFVDIVMPRALHGVVAWSMVERWAQARMHARSSVGGVGSVGVGSSGVGSSGVDAMDPSVGLGAHRDTSLRHAVAELDHAMDSQRTHEFDPGISSRFPIDERREGGAWRHWHARSA